MKDFTVESAPLNLFRFLAIIIIVFIHYGGGFFKYYISGGPLVTFFYILSGYGMFLGNQKHERINLRQYFTRRATRLLPFYYAALFMMVLFLILSSRFSFTGFFLSLFCIQSWFPNYQFSVNPPAWFVTNLMFFYCVFPAIHSLIKKETPDATRLLFSGLLLWVFTLIVHNVIMSSFPATYSDYIECFPLFHFSSFYLGICGAYFVTESETRKYLAVNNSLPYTGLILLFCVVHLIHPDVFTEIIGDKMLIESSWYAPLSLLVIIYLSTARNNLTKFLSIRFFGLLAIISFPVYIFQAPLHVIYTHFIGKFLEIKPGADTVLFLMFIMLAASVLNKIEIKLKSLLLKA
ncbi:MAG: acyltransferase [Deltaproteobacteria bacterium]|jgi:peptidoglycan/LPS O-acetylase OafA/YrhL|nr:acyltransferase [Deltaproteobacteria bacterium]